MTHTYTTEQLATIGGSLWERGNKKRVYFNNWIEYTDLELAHYKSGNVNGAWWAGEEISNAQGRSINACIQKIYYDYADNKFHMTYDRFESESRIISREDLFNMVIKRIKDAIAGL